MSSQKKTQSNFSVWTRAAFSVNAGDFFQDRKKESAPCWCGGEEEHKLVTCVTRGTGFCGRFGVRQKRSRVTEYETPHLWIPYDQPGSGSRQKQQTQGQSTVMDLCSGPGKSICPLLNKSKAMVADMGWTELKEQFRKQYCSVSSCCTLQHNTQHNNRCMHGTAHLHMDPPM